MSVGYYKWSCNSYTQIFIHSFSSAYVRDNLCSSLLTDCSLTWRDLYPTLTYWHLLLEGEATIEKPYATKAFDVTSVMSAPPFPFFFLFFSNLHLSASHWLSARLSSSSRCCVLVSAVLGGPREMPPHVQPGWKVRTLRTECSGLLEKTCLLCSACLSFGRGVTEGGRGHNMWEGASNVE